MSSTSNAWIFTYILLSLPVHFTVSAAVHPFPINGTCHDTCGTMPVKYPFGSGFGCGHPDFSRYVRCNSDMLEFSTGTGIYSISEIDYTTGSLIITDPFMSTCSSMQNSGSFSLDRASPFSLTGENIFVLLGCSTNSPLFDPAEDLCATGSRSRVCRGLYSCKGVTGLGLPQNAPPSTCCVYESPIQLAGYTLDLPKLQCSSYTSVYSFGGSEGDPAKWKFGISLQYNGVGRTPPLVVLAKAMPGAGHGTQKFKPSSVLEPETVKLAKERNKRSSKWNLALVAGTFYLKIGNERSPRVSLELIPSWVKCSTLFSN
ncbi:LEAF RUST 10 DISEASE-RESISTANCE LOCUS RECEPTOR-LIKE PROTEIN KINASE-like 1.5 [Populus alba x Populus x berolinensis]|uniref:LEAF RUST 10 DISEASE-RESISTANCE LOCUS RECEPTOR-LIKE PROTEIN KINASE-like 1.5 n=1 Tax=Populus alba x Populus x berolinensis TaxID=444605 RepID=A0AAD6MCQ4_9ROSI|nr:LEAF RUST 10 DISEASE-RESISTANCE LOCUS RECEPTOR-LIKE PROTEIN KINASE-like 1.5 [Populus alba x Populus x berolinensis]